MHKLDNLPKRNSVKDRKRVGRGHGSGLVKTSGRGQTGQKSRAGGNIPPDFQGVGISFFRRIPKLGGFKPLNKIVYSPVNVGDLDRFDDGAEITVDTLKQAGLVRTKDQFVKLLGDGDLSKKLTVTVHKWSKAAEDKVQKAGGQLNKA
jgi:large subunit ribosomal protein L15